MTSSGKAADARWRRHGDNALRLVAALPGGYAVASLWAMALARILPGGPASATVVATLIAFVVCAVAVMWAYAARSGWRAVWTLTIAGALAGAIAWGSILTGGRV